MITPRSKFLSQASRVKVSSKTTITVDESPLRPVSTDPIIERAVNDGKLLIASTQRVEPLLPQLEEDDKITCQHVIGQSICMPHTDWEFLFDIYFAWSRPASYNPYYNRRVTVSQRSRHHTCRRSQSQTNTQVPQQKYSVSSTHRLRASTDFEPREKVYVYATIRVSYAQLERIDNTVVKQMSLGHKYFAMPDEKYPQIHNLQKYHSILKKRGQSVINDMFKEEEFMIKPTLPPKRVGFFKGAKPAKYKDLKALANYLHILFSSPSLAQQPFLYSELAMDEDLVILLRSLASNKLDAWKLHANQPCIKSPSKLLNKLGDEYEFHTVYIVRRPLNDSSLSLFNFNHWALKFEGSKHLMTTEFFAYNGEHGLVKTRILPNTLIGRRVFWYWWQRDIYDIEQPQSQYFTDRWANMEMIYVGKIKIECIGTLICKWLSINSNSQYSVSNNNCQHFVRDLVTILDMKIARKLNGLMDHRVVAAAIPAAALADGMSEDARTNEVYETLRKELEKFKQRSVAVPVRCDDDEKKEKEEQLLNNFNTVAQQLGLNFDDIEDDDDDLDHDYMHGDMKAKQANYKRIATRNNTISSMVSASGPTLSHSISCRDTSRSKENEQPHQDDGEHVQENNIVTTAKSKKHSK